MLALLAAVGLGLGVARTSGLAQSAGADAFAQGRGAGQGGGQQGGRGGGRGVQTRDNQPQNIGTSGIRGAVYSDDSGTPVRRARVTLSGTGLRGGRSTVTDDQGAYEFLALPAGRFTMTASKPGYVNNSYGARSPGRPGTPIQLAENQTLEKAYIALPRGGVITGIVVDDHGEPAAGTQVRVMRFVMRSGERSLQQAGLDTADDRGMYRVYGLQPGDYMVSAIPRNQNVGDLRAALTSEVEALLGQAGANQAGRGGGGGRGGFGGGALAGLGGIVGGGNTQDLIDRAAELQAQLQAQEQEQNVAYAPVFYPGTTSPSSATNVSLGIGAERSSVDFQLQLVQTARVAGTVMSPSGVLPQGTQVSLVSTDRGGLPNLPGINQNTARVNQEGQFSFQNITPGQYSLQARATEREVDPNAAAQQGGRGGRGGGRGGAITQVLWAAMDVSISGTSLENLVLNLQPGMSVTGDVQFQGTTGQRPDDMTAIRITLTPRGPQPFEIGGIPPAEVDENGRFTITGVAPGHYMIQAGVGGGRGGGGRGGGRGGAAVTATGQNVSAQWALESARVNGVEALDFPFEVAPNQSVGGVMLTFADRTQQVSGMLQDSSGRPTADYTIIVYPTDSRYWLPQSRRIASARPDTDGRYTIRNLPPGEYRLTAITDAEPGEWYDPAFLSQLGPASIPFTLTAGQSFVQDVRLSGGGERP